MPTRPPRQHADPEPLWRQAMKQWTDAQREEYEERVAIMQFCGKMSQEEAERAAFDCVAKRRGG